MHLPLDRLRCDQQSVLFEDEVHYHTIVNDLNNGLNLRITSIPKPVGKDVPVFCIPIDWDSGILALSPEEVKFHSNSKQFRSPASTRCPPALSKLLESGTHLEHVLVQATDKVITLYLFHLSGTSNLQIWRAQVLANQSSLLLQQLSNNKAELDSALPHDAQQEDFRLVKKTAVQRGNGDEFHLSYAGKGEVTHYHVSIDDGTFRFRHLDSTRIISDDLTLVIADDGTKIATGQSKNERRT